MKNVFLQAEISVMLVASISIFDYNANAGELIFYDSDGNNYTE